MRKRINKRSTRKPKIGCAQLLKIQLSARIAVNRLLACVLITANMKRFWKAWKLWIIKELHARLCTKAERNELNVLSNRNNKISKEETCAAAACELTPSIDAGWEFVAVSARCRTTLKMRILIVTAKQSLRPGSVAKMRKRINIRSTWKPKKIKEMRLRI